MRNHVKVAVLIFALIMYLYCTYVKSMFESFPGTFETLFFVVLLGGIICSTMLSEVIITSIFKHYYKKFVSMYDQRQHLYLYADTVGFHEKIHNFFMHISLLDARSEYSGARGRLKLRSDLILPLYRAVANIDVINQIDFKLFASETNILPMDFISFGVKERLNEMLPKVPTIADVTQLKDTRVDSIQKHLDEDLMESIK